MTSLSERIQGWIREGAYGRLFVLGALFVAAYVALDAATYLFPVLPFAATPWNPQPALGVTLVAAAGAWAAPALLAAVLVAEALLRDAPGGGTGFVLACLGTAASYSAAGLVLRRATGLAAGRTSLRDLTLFLAVAVGAAGLASAWYVGAYVADGTLARQQAGAVLVRLWIGDALGLIVAAPLLLLAVGGGWHRATAQAATHRGFALGLALLVLALAVVLALVFGIRPLDEFRLSYLLFLPMIAFALRYGLAGAALALPVAQIGLLVALAAAQTRSATAFEFQLMMLALAITTLYFGALASERARAAEALAAREVALREQQRELARIQRTAAAAELAATLAHELNQPLAAIANYAGASRVLAAGNEEQRAELQHTLARIAHESARAGLFVRRMRDFFKTGTAHREPVAVDELIGQAAAQVRDRMLALAVQWDSVVAPGLPPLRVDRVQIGAALNNLLANALDAMADSPAPRHLGVRARATTLDGAPAIAIEVQDSGPGVDPDVREQLFQPMATSKPQGMGLGLAMARTIAQQHGGSLALDSAAAATTFCLLLPTDEP